ncbi:SemiSWEET transporter [Leeia aquatica]|uniref:SemiSWEET transporter n=1 Tax=Leeia aquatica TaxID=2725557 RepID=A0A847RWG0_9NEIS|nr:SemiSWEET transporter [Leeia aquatica]NLR74141.1 SemiSWEET transporter [Leeia aquatica]
MNLIDGIGMVAACCTTFAFLPQALKVWRDRSARDISLATYLLLVMGIALWLWYGLLIQSLPVILANACSLLLAGSVLVMKWRFDRMLVVHRIKAPCPQAGHCD